MKSGRLIAATSETAAIAQKTRCPNRLRRAVSRPATAPSSTIVRVTPATRIGLSLRPTTWISDSTTGPGVLAITTSATTSTGVARPFSRCVTTWLAATPARPGHGAGEREPVTGRGGHVSMFAHGP